MWRMGCVMIVCYWLTIEPNLAESSLSNAGYAFFYQKIEFAVFFHVVGGNLGIVTVAPKDIDSSGPFDGCS